MDTASQTLTLLATVGHRSTFQTGMTLANSFRGSLRGKHLPRENQKAFVFGWEKGQWTELLRRSH